MSRHISTYRLHELSGEAIIINIEEARHLRECDACEILLRQFADLRIRELEKKVGLTFSLGEAGEGLLA